MLNAKIKHLVPRIRHSNIKTKSSGNDNSKDFRATLSGDF